MNYSTRVTESHEARAHSLMETIIRLDALDITSDELYECLFPFHQCDFVDFLECRQRKCLLSLHLVLFTKKNK